MPRADLSADQMSKADLRADLFRNAPRLGTNNDSDDNQNKDNNNINNNNNNNIHHIGWPATMRAGRLAG